MRRCSEWRAGEGEVLGCQAADGTEINAPAEEYDGIRWGVHSPRLLPGRPAATPTEILGDKMQAG
jgi:hypothetical protein